MSDVETNGIQTYYEDYGDGRPIVVLHGTTADHQVWAEQLQPLTDDYRVVLYDLRGHGKTGRSVLNRYTVDTYVDDLAAFIEALDVDRPTVLGHSLGGMIGYAFADSYPERLSDLIAVGAMTPENFSTPKWAFKTAYVRVTSGFLPPWCGLSRSSSGMIRRWTSTSYNKSVRPTGARGRNSRRANVRRFCPRHGSTSRRVGRGSCPVSPSCCCTARTNRSSNHTQNISRRDSRTAGLRRYRVRVTTHTSTIRSSSVLGFGSSAKQSTRVGRRLQIPRNRVSGCSHVVNPEVTCLRKGVHR